MNTLTKYAAVLALAGSLAACGGDRSAGSISVGANDKQSMTRAKSAANVYDVTVQQLYVSYFGRPADAGGLANFAAALQAAGAPPDIQGLNQAYGSNPAVKALVDSFGTSAESRALYGNGNTTAFVTAIYQNVLGRAPDSAGLSFWVGAIDNGHLTQSNAALSIMAGAQANTSAQGLLDANLISNRVTVAQNFTSAVPLSTYDGATAAADARTMLSLVTAATDVTSFQANVAGDCCRDHRQSGNFRKHGHARWRIDTRFQYPVRRGNPGLRNQLHLFRLDRCTQRVAVDLRPTSAKRRLLPLSIATFQVPASAPTRIVQGGKIWLLPASWRSAGSGYVGSNIHVFDYLASDGQTVLTTSQFYNYVATPVSGLMDNSPEELLAAYPIADWIKFNNFSANAQWQAGAGYVRKRGNRVGDTIIASDCTNVSTPVYTSGTALTPCQSNTTLDNFFPITLVTNYPYETDFAGDGAISTVQGVRMWIANAPLPLAVSSVQAYRVFYEMGGNVYMAMIEKDGSVYNYTQPDGSVVNYLLTLNQAAVNSVQQGIITGSIAAGSQVGTSAEVTTTDLFGIGGHGVNGSLSPMDLRAHYNIPSNLTGVGQTIGIIDPPGTGDAIADDLNVFSQYFNLPQCNAANPCFQHIDLSNGAPVSSSNDAGREAELDTQMAHGIAPAAKSYLGDCSQQFVARPDSGNELRRQYFGRNRRLDEFQRECRRLSIDRGDATAGFPVHRWSRFLCQQRRQWLCRQRPVSRLGGVGDRSRRHPHQFRTMGIFGQRHRRGVFQRRHQSDRSVAHLASEPVRGERHRYQFQTRNSGCGGGSRPPT